MGIYDPSRPRVSVDVEHLLITTLAGNMPDGVTVTFAPDAKMLDFATVPDESYPMVVIELFGGGDIQGGTYKDGDVWDVGITCLDINRDDEPSSHSNASTLADICLDKMYGLAKRQASAPGIGTIHTVKNTDRPSRTKTLSAGDKQRTQFDAVYEVTVRPSNRPPINPS